MEIEFKLCIPPDRLAALQTAVRRGAWRQLPLEARYLDTPDKALAARGIALRLRREGAHWVQTVKALGDGPLDREEHNVVIDSCEPGAATLPRPDLHSCSVAGARLLAALHQAQGPLAETYCTAIDRVTRDLHIQGGVVELALDTGWVVAHRGTAQENKARICELELELKSGPVAGLAATALRWAAKHGLFLSTVSKAERGERLMAAPQPWPATKAEPLRVASRKRFLKGPQLQRAVVANCLLQVLANASEIAEEAGDEEAVHQLRIGIRRLRTALRTLGPLAPGAFDPAWDAPLVDVFQRLGQLRDRGQILHVMDAQLRAAGAPHALASAAVQAPAPGAADIVRVPAFQAALIGLMAFSSGAHAAGDDAGALGTKDSRRLLAKKLRRLHGQVQKDARHFAALPVDEQHRLRKRLKRLRYLAEILAPALGAGTKPFLDSLQPALSALGRLNDERVAQAQYRDLAETDARAWFGAGWWPRCLAVAARPAPNCARR